MSRKMLLSGMTALVVADAVSVLALSAAADPAPGPTGERLHGGVLSKPNSGQVVEPVWDDITNEIKYVSTPRGVSDPVNSNPIASAPFYLPVYPTSSTVPAQFTLNCLDTVAALNTVENCPDHGPVVASVVQAIASHFTAPFTDIYAGGVAGHDHLMSGPGTKSAGGDFNIAWVPTLVIFTNAAAANVHVTTLDQLNADVANHDAILVPLDGTNGTPNRTFHCSVVPASLFDNSTPYTLG